MRNPCCSTMKASTLTLDDIRRDPDLSADGIPEDWAPLVEWVDHLGAFVIRHTVIFYCPWCAAKLPDGTDKSLAKARATGVVVEITRDGELKATVEGKPAEAAFVAELERAAGDQRDD